MYIGVLDLVLSIRIKSFPSPWYFTKGTDDVAIENDRIVRQLVSLDAIWNAEEGSRVALMNAIRRNKRSSFIENIQHTRWWAVYLEFVEKIIVRDRHTEAHSHRGEFIVMTSICCFDCTYVRTYSAVSDTHTQRDTAES